MFVELLPLCGNNTHLRYASIHNAIYRFILCRATRCTVAENTKILAKIGIGIIIPKWIKN